ncbi:ABC transporter ATP-binding protein [Clostridium sp.]|uniref:ABC transporter ATP-binding protein n=1 Tax=Clostridium sp. TaxID=1506 RepID=UPI0026263D5E|nr:ABC transporter ATP-binding protein [Clostridium sp.]
MIKGKELSFNYSGEKNIINDLNIEIKEGEITTIIGPNGCGKSTLLSLLCALNKCKSGQVYLENVKMNSLKYKDIAKTLATVHQQNSVPKDIKVEELVSYGRYPHKSYFKGSDNEDKSIVEWALNSTGLIKLKDKSVMNLSGGERQRAFISMALAQKPRILFLDEPTTYLDIFHQIEILEIVKKLNKESGLTVVMVLHDINQAIKYSHNIVVMKGGKIVREGKSDLIIDKDLLKEVYRVDGIINKCEETGEVYFIPKTIC